MINKTTWRKGVKHQAGTANNAAKLDEGMVRDIRRSTEITSAALADFWGVSLRTVQRVRARKTWKHVA